jgi:hypothetical protein
VKERSEKSEKEGPIVKEVAGHIQDKKRISMVKQRSAALLLVPDGCSGRGRNRQQLMPDSEIQLRTHPGLPVSPHLCHA